MNGLNETALALAGTKVELRILATTDVHLHVLPFDYYRNDDRDSVGLARTATLIHEARAEAANTLLVDNGDFLCGLPLELSGYDLATPGCGARIAHPIVEIMNHLGYDAATLGNHDLDHGLDFARKALADADFAVVSSNLDLPPPEADQPDPITRLGLLERSVIDAEGRSHRLRIGLVGLVPPGSLARQGARRDGPPLTAGDMLAAARETAAHLRKNGADLIIALAHAGIASDEPGACQESIAGALTGIEGIDAVVAGHLHQVFPGDPAISGANVDHASGTIGGKPVVSAGFWGSHLGVIDLGLAHDGGAWIVTSGQAGTRAISTRDTDGRLRPLVESDDVVSAMATPIHARLQSCISTPVGRTRQPIHSCFALAAPSSAVQVIQRASLWFARHRNLPGLGEDGLLVASAAPFRNGGLGAAEDFTHIARGELTMRDVADLYPFPNRIAYLEMTGAALADWLERAASVFNRLEPGVEGQRLKPAGVPGYLFETVLGVDYEIDLSQPARYSPEGALADAAARRITGLRHQGRPIAPDQRVVMVTNSHRAAGGGHYPAACLSRPLPGPDADMREVLLSYFGAHPALDLVIEPHWRHIARAGSQAGFCSAPAAFGEIGEAERKAGISAVSPEPQPTGYLGCLIDF